MSLRPPVSDRIAYLSDSGATYIPDSACNKGKQTCMMACDLLVGCK
jgi:hypothetical protein